MGWRDLSFEERDALYQRKKQGEDIIVLAEEIGANPLTLDRQLRKFAQDMRGEGETASDDENVAIQEKGNYLEVESNSDRITTLEQLLEYCAVDLEEWAVERHIINKWEVGRKATEKEISWTNGVADGYTHDSGGINVEPLFQIKVWLIRKKPIEITPALKPVQFNVTVKHGWKRERSMKAALVIPDTQIGFARDVLTGELKPFHDRVAMSLALQVANIVEPDMAVFLGDVLDWSAWSDKFIRMPEFYFTTQPSLIEGAWYIGQVKAVTNGPVYVMDGNHDIRPETQIVKHLMEAYQLRPADQLEMPAMGIDNLMGLTRMGVEYVKGYPDAEVWLNDSARFIHGTKVRGIPGQTAAAVVQAVNETTVFGHIHRFELATRTIRSRTGYRTVTAFSPGCLCHIDGRVPGSSKTDQWQQGLAVIWYDEERSVIHPIPIDNGSAVYDGELIRGEDYVAELIKDTNWKF